jgi:hypothetical protein
MRQIPGYRLWLGHIGDARDLRGVLDAGIEAVVDLARDEPPVVMTRELVYCRFPLIDGEGNPPWLLRAAVRTVADLLRCGVPTLVYCGACLSRTPAIAAAVIAEVSGINLDEALRLVVASGSADVSPALWMELRNMSRDIEGVTQ